MRLAASIVVSLAWGIALPATVYKWVDANGVTHYSDQPHPGAQKIEVSEPQTYSAPPPANQQAAAQSNATAGPVYATCELFSPAAEEVLFNVSTVTTKLRLDPDLRPGDKVTIALDGKRLLAGVAASGNAYTVSPVYRGTHTILAEVTDPEGKAVCRTPVVTFHVRQASTLSPQSPTRPKPSPRAPQPPTRP
jgi:hypothetical protein